MLPGVLQLENDNSPGVFFARDAAALRRYRQFRREFGGGQAVRVVLSGRGLWTKRGLGWLDELENRAGLLPGVEAAIGLAAQHRWLLLEWPPPDPAGFRARVLKEGPDTGAGWVSPDGEIVTMLVVIADLPPGAGRELLHRLDELIARPPPGIRAHISGLPVLHLAMDRSLLATATRFLPLLVLLAAIFIAVIFRRLRDVAVPLVFVGVCQVILFGVIGYLGGRLNLVNIILAPLLFVISLATAVHLLVCFRDLARGEINSAGAVLETYRTRGWPVLWTGFTTLVAFGSLVFASVPPVRTLGAWAALGIAVMTILAFTLYPVLLSAAPKKSMQQAVCPFETWARRRGRAWAHWAVFRRPLVLAATMAAFILAMLGMTRIQVEDNLGRYFPGRHPVRAQLGGAGEEEGATFLDPSAQQRLAQLSARLRSKPQVYGAISSGDLVEAAIRSTLVEGEVTDSIRWMALGLMQTAPESRKLLYALISADGQSARVTLLVPMLSFNRIEPLFREVIADAETFFPGTENWITGQYPLILLAQRKLMRGLIVSLSLTLLCVLLVFLLLLRSIRLTLRVLVPNLWPVALVLGGMGWLRIPLDSASVMTVSIVLGLAVDDTFHTLGYFLRLAPRRGPEMAIQETLERTAPAHILTSLILAVGFAVCSFSDLLIVARFGALSAVAIVFALVGDLFIIPALLARAVGKRQPRRHAKKREEKNRYQWEIPL
jgi:predicted RND superfamily exporter protein